MGLLQLSRSSGRLSKEAAGKAVNKGMGLLAPLALGTLGAGTAMAMTLPYDIKRGQTGFDPRYLAARRAGLVSGEEVRPQGGTFRGRQHLHREMRRHGQKLMNMGSNW